MRLVLPLAALACALVASGCGNLCQDLGDRLCECTPVGTTKASCERTVQAEVARVDPSREAEDICAEKLETCVAPDGVTFCDWLDGRCGKSACGLSEERWDVLSAAGGLCAPPAPP